MIHIMRCLPVLLITTTIAHGQPAQPPAPAKYKVMLRYHIPAPRDPHVIAYDAMIKHLKALNFEFDPPLETHPDTDREDRSKNYLKGTIAAGKALDLLEPLVVQSVLLVPDGFDLPAEADAPVMVRLELGGGLNPDRQRELANQTRVLLRELGFKEPVGYDHAGYSGRPQTRIVGTIPRGKLDILLRDLRFHPAGWLGPIIPLDEIPSPLREVNPVRVIEVMRDTEAIKELPAPEPRGAEYLGKVSPDLWELAKEKDPDIAAERVRVQVGMIGSGQNVRNDREWKIMLQEAIPDYFIEGRLGQFVTGTIRRSQVAKLASSPMVSVIRLPRPPRVDVDPSIKVKGDNKKALEQSNLKELHERGYLGKGVRVAIIDRDFRGWETLVKKGQLPKNTRLVDLTTELDPNIYPLPYRGKPDEPGHGTLCAQATALAAPQAELVLVRVDVIDPYQLHDVVRYIHGGALSATIEQRDGEIVAAGGALRLRRAELLEERKIILNDFTDEGEMLRVKSNFPKDYLEFLGPFYDWLYSDREWHRSRMIYHENLEAVHRRRAERFNDHLAAVETLKGIPIIVNSLSWHSGYPLGAISPLSRLLDDPKGPLWFQAVGNTRGQAWLGQYRQTPGDPALKFTADGVPLPKGRWSNEVNFLAWHPYQGDPKADLPEKTRVRLTLQWREPHDADYYLPGDEDPYHRPLARMRVQILRQRDPETKLLPADSFELVGRTTGWAERIEHLPDGSVYEQVLETTLDKAGRYAVRVEKQVSTQWILVPHPERRAPMFRQLTGLTPTGIRPLGAPTLPALEKNWDHRPRLFVEMIDEPNRVQGRAVFADFATTGGVIGVPADARNVISVGAASLANKPQPYSAFGSPSGMELARRPWLYAYDELELAGGGAFGTTVANAFAAGTVAAMLSGSQTRDQVIEMLRAQDGHVLRAPVGRK